MFINPHTAITEGWITHPKYETLDDWEAGKHLQPNAIDFDLSSVYAFVNDDGEGLWLSESHKQMRKQVMLTPKSIDSEDQYFEIPAHSAVDAMSNMFVTLPSGVAAMLIIRSTLSRNGIFLASGLYDSGFKGNCGFVLHNRGPKAYIAPGTRIGQIMFIRSEDSGIVYAGGYSNDQGKHWTHK